MDEMTRKLEMDAMRKTFGETVACEAKRPASICEIAEKNSHIITDINECMSVLLAILTGNNGEEACKPTKAPGCLMEDVSDQGITLGMIHSKVRKALDALGK